MKDINQLTKSITDDATKEESPQKNPAAISLGKLGGLKGASARVKSLTPEQRKEIAEKAAQVRWKKKREITQVLFLWQGLLNLRT